MLAGYSGVRRENAVMISTDLKRSFGGRYILGVVAAVNVLAACSGPQAATSGSAPAVAPLTQVASATASCDGQRTNKRYGEITVRLKPAGGSLCIPAFAGFGGSIEYPRVQHSAKLTVRTSSQNLYDEPQLGTGTSIVYLNLHFHAGDHFGKKVRSDLGLTSEAIVPGDTYTAYGIVGAGHLILYFPPCYSIATQGSYGGIFPNLGNLVSETTVTGAGYGVIEIYSGQQVSQEC
jgi:hypothetical protein